MLRHLLIFLTTHWVLFSFSQTSIPKVYFDKSGKACREDIAYYYRQETDTDNFYRSVYALNGKTYFQGKIKTASDEDENTNVYSGNCYWYFKNGNVKYARTFTESGQETGTSKYYYESGKIWKEIEYVGGRVKNNSYLEYDENGHRNRLFEESFDNNSNEWDLYSSDKSIADISNGSFKIVSKSRDGTSRYINYPLEADEYGIEAEIDLVKLHNNGMAGIIYGFKDWQNYHFFVISKKSIFVGTIYEGIKSIQVEDRPCASINSNQPNLIKVLCTGSSIYFTVNGDAVHKSDVYPLYGNNHGFVVNGNNEFKVNKFSIKEINISQSGKHEVSPVDKDVKKTGSGVIFNKEGYVLTNHHVTNDAKSITLEVTNNGIKTNYKAELVVEDEINDLAILKIADDSFKGSIDLKYSFKETGLLDVGESVFTIGFPYALSGMGKEAKFTDGKVSSKTGYNGSINSFQTSIPVQPGNSGGPVFNENGQMIGLINATFAESDNVSYAIKLNYIKNLIELAPEKIDPPTSTIVNNLSSAERIKALTNYVVLIKIK